MDYIETTRSFKTIVEKCRRTSQRFANIPSPSNKHFYASVLFTRICVTASSILLILPLDTDDHWDFASAASLVRNLIECNLVFFYLCVDKISGNEWGCRWNILNLHDCTARIRLFTLLNVKENIDKYEKHAADLKLRLEKNKYFNSLPEKKKKELLKGRTSFIKTQDEIVTSMGIDKNNFRCLYEFLSHQIHSLPLSFYNMGEGNRGRGIYSKIEEDYTKMILIQTMEFLNLAERDMNLIFSTVK